MSRGGDSEKVADDDSADNGASEGAANGQTTTEQGSTQTGDDSQQGAESQDPATAEIAEVNGTKYATLQAAIDAAQDGQTVTLLSDVEQNTQLTINKSIALDLNGKTTKNTEDIWGDKTNAILSITNGAKVIITGNGTIDAKENDCYTINVVKGDLTIENGTFYGNVSVVQVQEGTLSVKGGTFDLHQKWEGSSKYLFNCIDDAYVDGGANVAISGGTFVGFDPNVSPERKVDGKSPSFAAPGAGVTKNENGSFTANTGKTAQILDKDGNSVKACDTLQEAIDAAQDGQTVTLLADAAEDVAINKSITLDLGGKTLTNTNSGKATISVRGGTVTVKSGNVAGGTGYYNIEVTKGSNASLTLTDVTATAGNTGSSMIDNHGALTIASGAYTGGLDTVMNEPNARLTITGGTFTLTKGNSDGFTGVVFNYGELTISGGDFTQSDKSAPYGQAQVIHTDKSGSAVPSTVISGGTFKNLCTSSTTAWTVRATNAAAGSTQVKGGVFNKKPVESYWAEGYVLVKNADGMYGAKEGSYVAQLGSDKYDSVQAAVDSVKSSGTIKLLVDTNEDLVVNKGKKVVLDLNGCTLTNVNDHTIINNGTLTIKDSSAAKTGTVDNLTHGRAAVENSQGATCTIAGGNFTRGNEAGESSTNSGGNSYYYIENFGTMTIGGDVKVLSGGHFSSLVHNGWYDGRKNTEQTNAVMTINSGSFAGGINTIKNDDYGEITINGGTFQNATQHPLFNVNIATVNGGSFESTTDSAVYTKAYDDAGDKGTTTIKGGTFKSAAGKGDLKVDSSTHLSTVSVSGGSFSCEVPEAYRAVGFSSVKNSDGTYGVAKKGASAESTGGKTSGSVATNNEVVVEQEEQKKFAETATGAAEAVKNVRVEPGAAEARIGDVTVDTSKDGKAAEVANVAEAAAENDVSVNVQLVVKANKAAETNEEIVKAAPKAKPIPFELSVDMVTEVKDASGAVKATSTVPVKELASEITVSITVNPASIKGKNVTVARVHGDAVDIIAPDSVDYDNGIVTFRTSKFSDYAVLANAKTANLSSYKVVNGTRTAPNPADFGVVNPEEYAFAGWYKDAGFTKPYTATAKSGTAYPKFVKISDLITFKGGSLRMDVGTPAELTYLRFGYNLAIPDKASFIENGWYYHRPQDEAVIQKSVVASNNVLNNDGTVTSNIVFSKVAKERYKPVYQVMAYVKYKTSDGTEVEAKENAYQGRSVLDVAQAIQNHQMASATEKAYAQEIINATSE